MGAKREKNDIYERGNKATEETTSEWHHPQEEGGKHSIKKFKFRKLNQRISASVQGTPRRDNEQIAQGIALGMMKR